MTGHRAEILPSQRTSKSRTLISFYNKSTLNVFYLYLTPTSELLHGNGTKTKQQQQQQIVLFRLNLLSSCLYFVVEVLNV